MKGMNEWMDDDVEGKKRGTCKCSSFALSFLQSSISTIADSSLAIFPVQSLDNFFQSKPAGMSVSLHLTFLSHLHSFSFLLASSVIQRVY